MCKISLLLISILFAFTAFANRGVGVTEKSNRIALVIGNSNYQSTPLRNPVNDANDMALILKQKGFVVTLLTDASKRQMKKAIGQFGKKLRDGGVGLFFYAGHGMQVDGTNYLIPIGAEIEAEDDIEYESVDANRILSKMESAGNDLNMVFLDACRNNPFARSFRSSSKGLAQMDAPKGSFVSFATAPGSVAADGDGRNGLFTGQLLKYMQVPGLPITEMMMQVRKGVLRESDDQQTPWDVSSLTGNFYFSGGDDQEITTVPVEEPITQPVVKTNTDASEMESEMWAMVKDSRNVTDLEIFMESYPNGAYRSQADSKLWLLSGQSIESIKKYLTKYPNSPFKKAADKRVWDLINAKNSIGSYEHFINEFPNNRFVGFAKLKVSKLKQAEQERKEKERLEKERKEMEERERLESELGIVLIKGGCFQMGDTFGNGDSDEKPVHKVCLDDYYLGKHEVTQGQWQRIMGNNPSNFKNGDNYPVEQVSWNDAQKFIQKLNGQTDGKFRLPTEAEWEYACREGGRQVRFGNGKDIIDPNEANFDGSSNYKKSYSRTGQYRKKTTTVGSFQSNSLGLFDMSGNVWEWVSDWKGSYSSSSRNNPKGPSTGSLRVIRGGSWYYGPKRLRCADRIRDEPSFRSSYLGFRLARTP